MCDMGRRSVMQKLSERGRHAFRFLLRSWRRVPVRVQGMVTVGLPILAIAISATLALWGNYQRVNIETDVQRKFQMTSTLSEVLTLMLNAETGMRGYLLTRREEFLQPFATATENLPATMTRLHSLAAAEPGEQPRLKKLQRLERIQQLINQQMTDLASQQGYITTNDRNILATDIYTHLAYGKGLMDEIRANLNSMQTEEGHLLTERVAEINSIRQRDFLAVFLALVVGVGTRLIAWYLFKTGILRRMKRLAENARAMRRGESLAYPPSDRKDALGDLEIEIALASQQFASPKTIKKATEISFQQNSDAAQSET